MLGLLFLCFYAYKNEAKIADQILKGLHNEITTGLKVDSYEMSLFKNFPYATAKFKTVEILGTDQKPFLTADQLQLRLSLSSLLSAKTEIENVYLANAKIVIIDQGKGKRNYEVFRKKENGDGNFSLDFEKAIFKNVEIDYTNTISNQQHIIHLDQAQINGVVNEDYLNLMIDVDGKTKFLSSAKHRFIQNQAMSIKGNLEVHLADGIYQFNEMHLGLADNAISIDGNIQNKKGHDFYQLSFECPKGSAETIINLLPQDLQDEIDPYQIRGSIDIKGSIEGRKSKKENPKINIDYTTSQLSFAYELLQKPLKKVKFTGTYTNGILRNFQSSKFTFENLTAMGPNGKLSAEATVENLNQANLNLTLDGSLPASIAFHFIGTPPWIKKVAGNLNVKNFQLLDFVFGIKERSGLDVSGIFNLKNVELLTNNQSIKLSNGEVVLEEELIKANNVKVKHINSSFMLNGSIENAQSIFRNGDLSETQFTAAIKGERLDLGPFLVGLGALDPSSIAKRKDKSKAELIAARYQDLKTPFGDLSLDLKAFTFQRLKAQQLSSTLAFKGYQIEAESEMDIMEGHLTQKGLIHLNPNIQLLSSIETKGIDLHECFSEMENFDQQTIRADHLQGELNGKFIVDASWDHNGSFLGKRMEMQGAIEINDGSLKNFSMLERFSKYIKIDDLKDLKFEQINNLIEIKNGKVFLPVMFIQSNACNLTVQGVHTFDNDILYNLKINAGQVLGAKFQKHQKDLRPQKANKKGWLNMYYFLHGNIDDFKYKAKAKIVKSNFLQSDDHRYEIKQKLIDAFGFIPMISEPIDWQDIPEYEGEEYDESIEEEFIEFEQED